ncbi:homeobox-domain-containing protein [Lichtheimia hyalospora FSU 10163]|nr:homeobox-domain-containing protein [Lichtheimia hyalospora FSU 10163]
MQSFEQSFTIPTTTSVYSSSSNGVSDRNYLLETFHQLPHGDFRPTFYNPFEIKHRRRTSRAQLKVLEKSFAENSKPNATVRRILAQKLDMTPRGVQIWFQNRRAKAKMQRRKSYVEYTTCYQQTSNDTDKQQHDTKENEYSDQATESRKTTDMDQSALFSQFFANVQTQSDKPAFTTYLPPRSHGAAPAGNADMQPAWGYLPWQQQQQQQQQEDNVRSVATMAAAVAAAASYEQGNSNMVHMGIPENNDQEWLAMPTHPLAHVKDPSVMRRKSCPVPCDTVFDPAIDQSQQYKERRVSENDTSSYKIATAAAEASTRWSAVNMADNITPTNTLCASTHHQVPSSSSLVHMEFYQQFQDSHLDCAPITPQYQLTPPLAASSCSASSGSNSATGSPISISGCYDSGAFDCFNLASHPEMVVPHLPPSSSSAHIPAQAFSTQHLA